MKNARRRMLAIAGLVFWIGLACIPAAGAAELKVLSGFAMKPVLDEVAPQFESSAGHKLNVQYQSSAGMKRVIDGGEPFDVAIVTQAIVEELTKQAKIGSPTVVARAGVGIAVKSGAPRPAMDSAEAFKRALVNAKSIAYAGEGATAAHFNRIVERLGIAAEMKTRAKPQKSAEAVGRAVADGAVELGFSAISAIRASPGVDLAGSLPPELQDYVIYSAGVAPQAKNAEGARALVRFLTEERTAATLRMKGMEPGSAR